MLDLRTTFLGYIISNVLIAVLLFTLWRQYQNRYNGLLFWFAACLMQVLGLWLAMVRDILPDIVTIIIANLLIMSAYLILYMGLERFVGQKSSQRHNFVILAVYTGFMGYFTYLQADIYARIISNAAVIFLIAAQCSDLMLRRVGVQLKPITRYVGLTSLLYVFVSFVQIIFIGLNRPLTSERLFQLPAWYALIILLLGMLSIGLTFALVMMVTGRLWLDTERQAAERKWADEIMQARLRLMQFSASHSAEALLQATIDEVEGLTGSSVEVKNMLKRGYDNECEDLSNKIGQNSFNAMCNFTIMRSKTDK